MLSLGVSLQESWRMAFRLRHCLELWCFVPSTLCLPLGLLGSSLSLTSSPQTSPLSGTQSVLWVLLHWPIAGWASSPHQNIRSPKQWLRTHFKLLSWPVHRAPPLPFTNQAKNTVLKFLFSEILLFSKLDPKSAWKSCRTWREAVRGTHWNDSWRLCRNACTRCTWDPELGSDKPLPSPTQGKPPTLPFTWDETQNFYGIQNEIYVSIPRELCISLLSRNQPDFQFSKGWPWSHGPMVCPNSDVWVPSSFTWLMDQFFAPSPWASHFSSSGKLWSPVCSSRKCENSTHPTGCFRDYTYGIRQGCPHLASPAPYLQSFIICMYYYWLNVFT